MTTAQKRDIKSLYGDLSRPAYIETITPSDAAEMLSRNTKSRAVSRSQVESLAHDIRHGQFLCNGETIIIGDDGTIVDGQHRLTACVQADQPITSYVVRDMPTAARDTIDIGRKRTLGDVLGMAGIPNAALMGAIGRRAHAWDNGSRRIGKFDTRQTMRELELYILAHPELEVAATFATSNTGSVDVSPSILGFCYFMCARQSIEHVGKFYRRWTTGVGITEADPIRALNSILRTSYRLRELDKAAYVFSAWNHDRRGREVTKLQAPKGGWTADNVQGPF
jgi:hypothetical protein